jgi:hypothetical protein
MRKAEPLFISLRSQSLSYPRFAREVCGRSCSSEYEHGAGIAENGRSNSWGELVGVLVGEVAVTTLTRRGDFRNKRVFAGAGAIVPVGKRPPKPLSVGRSARLQAKTLKDQ